MSTNQEVENLQIPLQELSDATNGFSEQNLIGSDGFGIVYKGVSVKHGNIVIKMLDPWQGQGDHDHEFTTEIALLSVYKHENIVSLLGFCDEDGHKLLVYKYESNGRLDKQLENTDLTWIKRLQICLDAARGLQYLHDGAGSRHTIIHGDVKSSNIILDENWTPKVSDFGLSKMDPTYTQASFIISDSCGTIGYIDPAYMETGVLTKESDVYSFGVVLFEVLCGRLARLREYDGDDDEFLTDWVKSYWGKNRLEYIIYRNLMTQAHTTSLLTFTAIAYQCLMSRNKRPTMKTVVEQLQKALDKQLVTSDLWWHDGESGFLPGRFVFHSSSYPSWKYDVFISFRGEDTRKTFVDHLFSYLEDRQIFAYKDDEVLPRGEPIGPSLFMAIRQSRIAIIVFSKNYASSSWCLDELAYIMKNKHKGRQTVIPIFYDVKPSEARKQTGYYGEALARHKLENKNKVKSWRKALVKAGNLSGWEPQAMVNGHEAKAIRIICEDIKQKLLKLMTHTEASAEISANTDLIGVETRMQELKSFLKVGSGDVQMVGICGMWGSGKTTLASSVYENIRHEFEGYCFVKNVRAESRMHGLKTLQEKILSDVLKSKVKLKSIEQGISEIEKRFSRNSVLIVLDDVDHIDHLKMLAGSKKWFGTGSRIIITTRNQDLLNAHNVVTRNVRLLDVQEAIDLFSRHAFKKSKHVQGMEDVSKMLVSKLGGHPLALISLGTFLRGKDKSKWMRLLDRLICSPVDEILKKLETPDDGVARNIIPRFLTL